MKIIQNIGAQGDVILRRIDHLPAGLVPVAPEHGRLVVAHSETGHHHALDAREAQMFDRIERDPLRAYLSVTGEFVDLLHHRSHHTHETLRLPRGTYEVIRQRENGRTGEQVGPWAGRRAAD